MKREKKAKEVDPDGDNEAPKIDLEVSLPILYNDEVLTLIRIPFPLELDPKCILYSLAINSRAVSVIFWEKKDVLDFIDSFVSMSKCDAIGELRKEALLEIEAIKV